MNSRIVFFGLIVIILLIVCIFTARVYSEGLIADPSVSKKITIVSLFIGVTYIAGLAIRRSTTWLSRIPYVILNVIAAIFFYVFLGAIVLSIVDIILLFTIHTVPVSITWIILSLAVVVSSIGFIQARIIRVARYTVSLKGLPAAWQDKKAVLVTDTHFGLVNFKKFSEKVIAKILAEEPDFVLHGGDFYDGPTVDTTILTESWKKLTEQVRMFYTPGNHEAYGDYVTFVHSVRDAGATVLDDAMAEYEGVQIAGVHYHAGRDNTEVAEALERMHLDPTRPTILINHPPTSLLEAHAATVNLMVSGHTHRGQLWPFRYITRRIYKGYDYGMKQYKDMTVITSNGVGTFGPPNRFMNQAEIVVITFKTE